MYHSKTGKLVYSRLPTVVVVSQKLKHLVTEEVDTQPRLIDVSRKKFTNHPLSV